MIQLNYRDSRPIYEQVKDGFRKLILQNILEKDERLPSVREMATKLTINPNTIQRAYRELELEGYVYTIKGKGSFVSGITVPDKSTLEEAWKKLDDILDELNYLQVTFDEIIKYISDKRGKRE